MKRDRGTAHTKVLTAIFLCLVNTYEITQRYNEKKTETITKLTIHEEDQVHTDVHFSFPLLLIYFVCVIYILVMQCFLVGYREICHPSLVFSLWKRAFR